MEGVVATVAEVRARVAAARATGKTIGFVPTMGALHEGHLTLIRRARAECGYVVVSIFVNPTQFAPGSDFDKYPRDLEGDARKAEAASAELVFAPSVAEIYPPGDSTVVEVTGQLVDCLCGPRRPGHFRGVTTVCARLFNIVGADRAYFGEKDYQQLLVIRRMVRDLHLPVEIVAVPTVREADGLAMSSRNAYLSPEERKAAAALPRGLFAARDRFAAGERDGAALIAAAREVIGSEPLVTLEYLELRDAETLAEVKRVEGRAVLALAAYVGSARLIDNMILGARARPV
jgi:pantoate--beta-alanine ligase